MKVLARFIAQRPDVVILAHVNHGALALLMRMLHPRARQVFVVYGWDVWFGLPALRSRALRQADVIWSISDYTTDRLIQSIGVSPEQLRLLAPGLTVAQADALADRSEASDRRDDQPELLSVARLDATEREKGIDHVIGALNKLRNRLPYLRYRIVGYGNDRKRLEQLAENQGVSDRVEFAGRIDFPELAQLYQSCQVFILPSNQEGFGLVFAEAMAAGKPIIAARAGAVPEVVVDGKTGILVEFGDEGAIADAIDRLCGDAPLRERMGSAGRERFLERFSYERVRARFDELFGELVRVPDEPVARPGR
jgi:glycosyltransferase involved in cell wall biosynthesis